MECPHVTLESKRSHAYQAKRRKKNNVLIQYIQYMFGKLVCDFTWLPEKVINATNATAKEKIPFNKYFKNVNTTKDKTKIKLYF